MGATEQTDRSPEVYVYGDTGSHVVTRWHASIVVTEEVTGGGGAFTERRLECVHHHPTAAAAEGCQRRVVRLARSKRPEDAAKLLDLTGDPHDLKRRYW